MVAIVTASCAVSDRTTFPYILSYATDGSRLLQIGSAPGCCLSQTLSAYFKQSFIMYTRTSGPRYPPQFDRKKISQGGVSLLGGSQIKNTEEEEPPFKLLKSINFGGCSSGGWFFLQVLGLETTQQIHSPGGGRFLQSKLARVGNRTGVSLWS